LKRKESLFIQGIKKIKDGKFKNAERDLEKVVKKKSPESEKAQILLATLEVRRECQRLLGELE
jgi:outer membrane protein assembly factor BamD (BamD/ComL family)